MGGDVRVDGAVRGACFEASLPACAAPAGSGDDGAAPVSTVARNGGSAPGRDGIAPAPDGVPVPAGAQSNGQS
jgi:hypothetical protein